MTNDKKDLSITNVLVLSTASVLLILLSIIGVFNSIYSLAGLLTGNIRGDVNSQISRIGDTLDTFANINELKMERDKLRTKVLDLEKENIELREFEDQIKILEEQLGTTFKEEHTLVAAEIISLDVRKEGMAKINKGSEDSVSVGDVVVLKNFAIGEITDVDTYFSEVLLITSPNSKVPVVSQKNRTRGLLEGEFGGGLVVTGILVTDELGDSESFVTLGINNSYPDGLYVGSIDRLDDVQTETQKSAHLENAINFNNLTDIFVLKVKT